MEVAKERTCIELSGSEPTIKRLDRLMLKGGGVKGVSEC